MIICCATQIVHYRSPDSHSLCTPKILILAEYVFVANQAVDGSTTSHWASEWSDNQGIQINLGNVYSVTRVVLNWEAAYGKEYKIQTSLDATTWVDAAHITDGAVEVRTIHVSDKVCRYVRMQGILRGTAYGYSLWEFGVYGTLMPNVAPSE